MRKVSKSFGGVLALSDVDFTLMAGEIHGLVGENGAGKSTMMKIIAGVHTDFEGEMFVEGKSVRFHSTRDALAAGIGMVHRNCRSFLISLWLKMFSLACNPLNPAG